jgi:uncharacterized membrane protein
MQSNTKKSLIFCVILLLLSFTLLTSNPSAADDSLSFTNKNYTKIAQTSRSEEFIARGTEPFWSVTVSKSGITYSSPEKKLKFPYVTPLKAAGRPDDLVRVYPLKGRANSMLVLKKENNCSDGMSETKYSYSAILVLGNSVLEGCAETK